MLHIIQSSQPISVANVNLCVVGVKKFKFNIHKSKRKHIYQSCAKIGVAYLQYVGNRYARFE